jgi:hypothetical protein
MFTTEANIAITGLSRAGKTVFLTSLADNLEKNKDWQSELNYKTAFIPEGQSFNYKQYRKKIIEGKWPSGTNKLSNLKIELRGLNDKIIKRLNFIDYPGEWILDFKLLNMDFVQWSRDCYNIYGEREELAIFYKTLDLEDSTLEELSRLFKKGLKDLKEKAHFYNLTPGRFIMPDGEEDNEKMIFFPMNLVECSNKELRKIQQTDRYKQCEKNYKYYRKNYIKIKEFKNFDKQIVLIDIFEMLYNGHDANQNIQEAIKAMFRQYEYERYAVLNKIGSLFGIKAINDTAIVATKSDLISSDHIDNYEMLLDKVVEDTITNYKSIPNPPKRFVMSSLVVSEQVGDNLQAFVNDKLITFKIPIPEDFQSGSKWKKSALLYPRTYVTEYAHNEPLRTNGVLTMLKEIL